MFNFKYKDNYINLLETLDSSILCAKKSKSRIKEIFHKFGICIHKSEFTEDKDIYEEFLEICSILGLNQIKDTTRRKIFDLKKFDNTKLSSVDLDFPHVDPHSETSFSPARPAVISFVCLEISKSAEDKGLTTLIDGNMLWQRLTPKTKMILQSLSIEYSLAIDLDLKKREKGSRKSWFLEYNNISKTELDTKEAKLYFQFKSPFITEHPLSRKLILANHMFINLRTEPQILSRKLSSNENHFKLDNETLKDINFNIHLNLRTFKWSKGLSLFIDNNRYMHGRLPYNMNNTRRIFIKQFKNYNLI